jgi:thiol-disulfide isomerase/thioredoxin
MMKRNSLTERNQEMKQIIERNQPMKKAGIVLLSILIMLTLSIGVMAEEETYTFEDTGIEFNSLPDLESIQGYVMPYPMGAIDPQHETYLMEFVYIAMPTDEAEAVLYGEDATDEEVAQLEAALFMLPAVIITEGPTIDSAKKAYEDMMGSEYQLDFEAAKEVGSADGYTFYAIPAVSEEFLSSMDEEYAEDYKELEQGLLEAMENARYFAPDDPVKTIAGLKLQFTTTDLDGNEITSEDLFGENEITMVNCWGTWCPNCIGEMEELAQIHSRIQEKGCGIVGLEWEKEPGEATYQLAQQEMEEFGTNYPNVLMPEEGFEWVTGFPTTFFVDKEGTILSIPIVGAQVSRYEETLDSLLSGEDISAVQPESQDSVVPAVYLVHVVDEDGPVQGAAVQLCTDVLCNFDITGEDGIATFEGTGGGDCEIHILDVPEGYKKDTELYHPDANGEATITLEKEN